MCTCMYTYAHSYLYGTIYYPVLSCYNQLTFKSEIQASLMETQYRIKFPDDDDKKRDAKDS